MMYAILAAALLVASGCGDGSLVDAEVNPQVTDSLNPEVNPAIDLNAPISILGSSGS